MEEALAHPYLALLHDPNDEPTCESVFDFSFEDQPLTKESLKGALAERNTLEWRPFPKYHSSHFNCFHFDCLDAYRPIVGRSVQVYPARHAQSELARRIDGVCALNSHCVCLACSAFSPTVTAIT